MQGKCDRQPLAIAGGKLLAAMILLASPSVGFAAPAYSVWEMTCRQAQAVVAEKGAVVMYTAPASRLGPETYERFVRHNGYCGPQEDIEPSWAASRDSKTCLVGYRCVPQDLPLLPDE